MSYDVDVNQCITILHNVADDTEGYESANKTMSTAGETAAKDSKSQLVAGAVSGYLEKAYGKSVKSIGTLTGNAQSGLNQALTHVQEGDREMAHTSVSSLGETEGAGADAPGKGGAGHGSQNAS
ncbi:DUF6507 family protein [Rothia koreensis]|uniref:DUF6507 family protein n=1 Tax=Rothia koreensis TaxID=592378 RepID=UPI0015B8CB1D